MKRGLSVRGLTLEARLVASMDVGGPNDCWLWRSRVYRSGYGRIFVSGRHLRAHRVVYEFANGSIAAGLFVLHSCDVRACCNPAHLRVGTQAENVADMIARRRGGYLGEANGRAKLSAAEVLMIRAVGGTEKDVAARFGVSASLVGDIRRGKRWKHLDAK